MPVTAKFREWTDPGRPWGAAWLVSAPWAHPLWHDYLVLLYDLTTPAERPPVIHLKGATHEVMVCALDPAAPIDWSTADWDGSMPRHLAPANHGYQFRAISNLAARHRIETLVRAIERGTLSPDTDFTPVWDRIFSDGATMKCRHLGLLTTPAKGTA